MSFMFNIGKSKRAIGRGHGPLPPPAAPAPTPAMRGGSQMQLLIQRPTKIADLAQTARQTTQKHTIAAQDEQSKTQEYMTEVYADLKVLEEQQREASLKLDSVKVSKDQRQKKRLELELSLEDYKYSNGEHRAQLRRVRELLNASGAALSARKLRADSTEKDIVSFDSKLKKGLAAARTNNEIRRKIDSELLTLKSKLTIVLQLKNTASSNLVQLDEQREKSRRDLESRRDELKHEGLRVSEITKQVSETRSVLSDLENDLASAKQTEARSRHRVEAIDRSIQTEQNSIRETLRLLEEKMALYATTKEEHLEMTDQLQDEINTAHEEIQEARRKAVRIQKQFFPASDRTADAVADSSEVDDILSSRVDPSEAELISEVDMDGLSKSAIELLDKEEDALRSDNLANDIVRQAIDSLNLDLAAAQERESQLTVRAHETEEISSSLLSAETDRLEMMKQLAANRDVASSEVQQLHSAIRDLKERHTECRNKAEINSYLRQSSVSQKRDELKEIRDQLGTSSLSILSAKNSWAREHNELQDMSRKAKNRLQEVNMCFEDLSGKVQEDTSEIHLQLLDIEHAMASDVELIQLLITKYPELSNLEYSYRPEETFEEQMGIILREILGVCTQRITAARKVHSARVLAAREKVAAYERNKREAAKLDRKKTVERARQEGADSDKERQEAFFFLSEGEDSQSPATATAFYGDAPVESLSRGGRRKKQRQSRGGEEMQSSISLYKHVSTWDNVEQEIEKSVRPRKASQAHRGSDESMVPLGIPNKNSDGPRVTVGKHKYPSRKIKSSRHGSVMETEPNSRTTNKSRPGGGRLQKSSELDLARVDGRLGSEATTVEESLPLHPNTSQDRRVRWSKYLDESELDEPKATKTSRRLYRDDSPASETTVKTANAKKHAHQSTTTKKASRQRGSKEVHSTSSGRTSTGLSKKSDSKSFSSRSKSEIPPTRDLPKQVDSGTLPEKPRNASIGQSRRKTVKTMSKHSKDRTERRELTNKDSHEPSRKRHSQDMSSALLSTSSNGAVTGSRKVPKRSKNAKKKKIHDILGAKTNDSSYAAFGRDFDFSFC